MKISRDVDRLRFIADARLRLALYPKMSIVSAAAASTLSVKAATCPFAAVIAPGLLAPKCHHGRKGHHVQVFGEILGRPFTQHQ
jgi:hypothetical protein